MVTPKNKVRVRIAPSPTGPLHLGTVKTALYNYLFAKKHKGIFVLRIEDTDKERSDFQYEKDIIDNLQWLGLNWDEGPYRQSERLEIYKKYIKQLLDSGEAFWCCHTKDELEVEKNEQIASGLAPKHVCSHCDQTKKPDQQGIIRFRCPAQKVVFNDLIRGKIEFDCSLLGDISIAKDENTPLYQIAAVVDDSLMNITHIIRGEDHISNTPKQILLQQALGLQTPKYAHLPLILGPDKTKLSKRHGAVSMSWYREQGYLPQAMNNFAAFLGWNPGTVQEIFSLSELIENFSLDRVQRGGAIFNISRLDWFNGYYIRKLDLSKLTRLCLPYLIKAKLIAKDGPTETANHICPSNGKTQTKISFEKYKVIQTNEVVDLACLEKIIALEQNRMKKLSDISGLTEYFFEDKLDYDVDLLSWKNMNLKDIKIIFQETSEVLAKTDNFEQKTLEQALNPLTAKHGTGEVLWPLRAALSGLKASPSPYEIAEVLGKQKTLQRIADAVSKIQ